MDQKPPQSSETQQNPAQSGQTLSAAGTLPSATEEHKQEEHPAKPAPSSSESHTDIPAAAVEHPSDQVPPAPAATPSTQTGESSNATSAAASSPATTIGSSQDPTHKKGASMMYAMLTIVIVLIVGAGLMFMSTISGQQSATNTTTVQPTEIPVPTAQPTIVSSPVTPEEEVEAVNVTENDTDLQNAEKDLQAL